MGTHAISAAALKKCAVTDSILHFSSSISNPVCSHEWIVAQPGHYTRFGALPVAGHAGTIRNRCEIQSRVNSSMRLARTHREISGIASPNHSGLHTFP